MNQKERNQSRKRRLFVSTSGIKSLDSFITHSRHSILIQGYSSFAMSCHDLDTCSLVLDVRISLRKLVQQIILTKTHLSLLLLFNLLNLRQELVMEVSSVESLEPRNLSLTSGVTQSTKHLEWTRLVS